MRNERKHGATAQALKEAAVLYADAIGLHETPLSPAERAKAWDMLRKAAIRYATNPRLEGRPRK